MSCEGCEERRAKISAGKKIIDKKIAAAIKDFSHATVGWSKQFQNNWKQIFGESNGKSKTSSEHVRDRR
jgi:glucose-6-phosphate isomerase